MNEELALWSWSTSKGQVRVTMPNGLSALDYEGSINMAELMINQWRRWHERQVLIERKQDEATQETVSACMAWMMTPKEKAQ